MKKEISVVGDIRKEELEGTINMLTREGFVDLTQFAVTTKSELEYKDGVYSLNSYSLYHIVMEKLVDSEN